MINAFTGRSPRWDRYRAIAAKAASFYIRVSMMITPLSVSISDIFDRSNPLTLYTPAVSSNTTCMA